MKYNWDINPKERLISYSIKTIQGNKDSCNNIRKMELNENKWKKIMKNKMREKISERNQEVVVMKEKSEVNRKAQYIQLKK